jgi:hypothetical protein
MRLVPDKELKAPVQGVGEAVGAEQLPDDLNASMPPSIVSKLHKALSSVTLGSSLIISDYGFSRERGNDADFIVEIH